LGVVLDAAAISGLISSMLELSVPMAFAALGEVISERGGVINLGTEGVMLVGAISAFSVSFFLHGNLLGVLLGAFCGALLGLLMAFISISLKLCSAKFVLPSELKASQSYQSQSYPRFPY